MEGGGLRGCDLKLTSPEDQCLRCRQEHGSDLGLESSAAYIDRLFPPGEGGNGASAWEKGIGKARTGQEQACHAHGSHARFVRGGEGCFLWGHDLRTPCSFRWERKDWSGADAHPVATLANSSPSAVPAWLH